MKKALLTIEIEYDEEKTNAESIAAVVDNLLQLGQDSVPLDEYGDPEIGEAFVAMDDGKLTPHGRKIVGSEKRSPRGIRAGEGFVSTKWGET